MVGRNYNSPQLGIQNNRNIDVSIIVLVYNQSLSLRLILKSLLSQDFKGSYEIIVCDDGSNRKLFYEFRDSLDSAVVPIKYTWQQDRHFRAGAARNNGIRLSRGRYLIFLDGDMVPNQEFVAKHIAAHNRPKLLVAGNRLWRSFKGINNNYDKLPISKLLNKLRLQAANPKIQESEFLEQERRLKWLSSEHPWRACFSCNLSVRRSKEVYFDENFIGWGPDDQEFSYRLCKINAYIPIYKSEIIAHHLETVISKPFITGKHEDIVRYLINTFYFYNKCPGLKREDVFKWFSRFKLNPKLNKWEVVSRTETSSCDLKQIISQAKTWLVENKIYPKK